MKTTLLSLCTAVAVSMHACPASAAAMTSARTAPQQEQLDDTLQEYLALAIPYNKLCHEFGDMLKHVTGHESAEAAAPELMRIAKEIEGLNEKAFHLEVGRDISTYDTSAYCRKYVCTPEETKEEILSLATDFWRLSDPEIDCYGSEAFKEAMLTGLQAMSIPVGGPNERILRMYGYVTGALLETHEALQDVYATIKDKETADAAAPKVKRLRTQLRRLERGLGRFKLFILQTNPDTESEASVRYPRVERDLLNHLVQEGQSTVGFSSTRPPFYGSKALAEAVDSTMPTPHRLELEYICSILRYLEDKDGADAAADKLEERIQYMQEALGHGLDLDTDFPGTDFPSIMEKLSGQNPPFYGSEKLQKLLTPLLRTGK